MKNFFYALTFVLLFFSFTVCFAESENKPQELTEKQKLVSEVIELSSEDFKTKWTNSYTIELTIDPEYYSHLSETEAKESAEKKATLIATHGYKITGNNICVRIIDPSLGELAYKCKGNTPS